MEKPKFKTKAQRLIAGLTDRNKVIHQKIELPDGRSFLIPFSNLYEFLYKLEDNEFEEIINGGLYNEW